MSATRFSVETVGLIYVLTLALPWHSVLSPYRLHPAPGVERVSPGTPIAKLVGGCVNLRNTPADYYLHGSLLLPQLELRPYPSACAELAGPLRVGSDEGLKHVRMACGLAWRV